MAESAQMGEAAGPRNGTAWWAAGLIVALTVLRFWLVGRIELVGDEAYYWLWAQHPDWSYYSKGPLVAWAIALGTGLWGDTEFGVRFVSVCLGSGSLGLLYLLGRRLFSPRAGLAVVILAATTPLFVVGSLLMTIDPLSLFFWLAAALAFWHAKQSVRLGPWVATGALIGLGMLGKYTNAAQIPSLALFLAWTPAYRAHLRRRTFWVMTLTALLFLVPVLWWNAAHEWITFTHLRERGALDEPWRPSAGSLLGFAGGQLAVYFPVYAGAVVWALCSGRLRRRFPVGWRFTAALALPLLAGYTLLALNDPGEANWTAPAVISGLLLVGGAWAARAGESAAWRRWGRVAALGAAACCVLLLAVTQVPLSPADRPWLRRLGARDDRDLLYRVRGWRDLAARVQAFGDTHDTPVVVARERELASLLAFYLPGHPRTFIPSRPRIQNQFSFWPDYRDGAFGDAAVFVTPYDAPPADFPPQFTALEAPVEVVSHWRGRPVRRFRLFACRGLLPAGEAVP